MKEKVKIHPGGLRLINPLQRVQIDKFYFDLVAEHNVAKNLQTLKKHLIKKGKDAIKYYCVMHDLYNKIAYATEKIRCEQTTCIAMVIKFKNNYSVKVTYKFMEITNPKRGVMMNILYNAEKYMGRITKINGTQIFFDPYFEPATVFSSKCKVSIIASTFNLESLSRTINCISSRDKLSCSLIFPTISPSEMPVSDYLMKEDALLQSISFTQDTYNRCQQRAIAGILLRNTYVPYIILGPPGTGKTTTLVEAVIQLVRANETNRILICTPSNAAADHFTISLLRKEALDKDSIFRVYSSTHLPKDKSKKILPVTFRIGNDSSIFGIPPAIELLQKYRVFVMTLLCSTYFVSAGLKGAFSHIIVDEAGQANETEIMVPLSGLGCESTRFVLVGDPKQLGPVDTVKLPKDLDINCGSMMERFLYIKFYADHDCRFFGMLRHNYRSHKSLVDFPSKVFYNNQLIAAVPLCKSNSLCQWSGLPNKGFPILWHSIKGNQLKVPNGTSLKNYKEAKVVVCYVKQLISAGVMFNEIGVISPYKYQVKLIRKKLANFSKDLMVDCVEKFQGSERRVIIVSTVRTKRMGFLNCRKRLNTTITRAKELLIIVGDHKNLVSDEVWRQFYEYCHENNAVINASDYPMDELIERLQMVDVKLQ